MTGYGKRSDLWSRLGYERRVVDPRHHPEKWVAWRKLRLAGVPPRQPDPAEGQWAHNFFNAQLRAPLLWLPLCSPANQSSRASVVPPAGSPTAYQYWGSLWEYMEEPLEMLAIHRKSIPSL